MKLIRMARTALNTRNVGYHPYVLRVEADKVCDLRYGTNPLQTAALYNPRSFLGSLRELRTGKQGPSQTNMEDMLYAALSLMYFDDAPSSIVMKHENLAGFATQCVEEQLSYTYRKSRDADFRAAFGCVAMLNRPVDAETAEAMQELFTEVVVAPGFDEGVVGSFDGSTRIFEYDEDAYKSIPRYTGDSSTTEVRRYPDGSIIESDVFLSPIRTVEDLRQHVASVRQPTERELRDLLTGYRLRVHSNSVRIVRDGYTTGIGAGQQDRVMCIDIAAYKTRALEYLAEEEGVKRVEDFRIHGSSLASDGFFPFPDSIDLADSLGIGAVLAPHGGQNFEKVLARADELGMAFVDLRGEMRFFDHH